MAIQVEKTICFALCTLCVTSYLQLLATARAKPVPTNETVGVNETVGSDCYCNGTNLTTMVDGHFLYEWLKFDSDHSIRHLSEAAENLAADTDDLQTESCYSDYSQHFNLVYHTSQPVTHALLRKFHNGFILHKKFIEENLLVLRIRKHLRKQLTTINTELDQTIARLYHVLNISGCNCQPKDCEQTSVTFEQLTQSTEHCFDDYSYPINDVAKLIFSGADYLRTIIMQLHKQNPHDQSVAAETIVKVENEWCHY